MPQCPVDVYSLSHLKFQKLNTKISNKRGSSDPAMPHAMGSTFWICRCTLFTNKFLFPAPNRYLPYQNSDENLSKKSQETPQPSHNNPKHLTRTCWLQDVSAYKLYPCLAHWSSSNYSIGKNISLYMAIITAREA